MAKKPDLTPHTRMPYGPQRPSALESPCWILVGLSAIALIAFFVFAALTFERGGDDVAAVVLPL